MSSPACAVACPRCCGHGSMDYQCGEVIYTDPEEGTCALCNGLGEVTPEERYHYLRSIERDGDHG